MDFHIELTQHTNKLKELKNFSSNEQQTKQYMIAPLIELLGYNLSDPHLVKHEYDADVRGKTAEKIDYAIMKDGKPIIIIECKHHQENVKNHVGQLQRYFHNLEAKYGIITNGVQYVFYTDLEKQNKMDMKPFLEIDLENLNMGHIEELKKFHREDFDPKQIREGASETKYINSYKKFLHLELETIPSNEYVSFVAKNLNDGKVVNQKVKNKFLQVIIEGNKQFLSELNRKNLNSLQEINEEKTRKGLKTEASNDKIVETTNDELEMYYIIKTILSKKVSPDRISHKDSQTYFSIILDGKVTKWLLRISFQKKLIQLTIRNSGSVDIIKLQNKDELYSLDKIILKSLESLS